MKKTFLLILALSTAFSVNAFDIRSCKANFIRYEGSDSFLEVIGHMVGGPSGQRTSQKIKAELIIDSYSSGRLILSIDGKAPVEKDVDLYDDGEKSRNYLENTSNIFDKYRNMNMDYPLVHQFRITKPSWFNFKPNARNTYGRFYILRLDSGKLDYYMELDGTNASECNKK